MAAAADRNHVNTSCGDTVKCRLDAGKSPIFRSQSPCTDISVRKSQRVTIFVRIYPYKSLKGLMTLCKSWGFTMILHPTCNHNVDVDGSVTNGALRSFNTDALLSSVPSFR